MAQIPSSLHNVLGPDVHKVTVDQLENLIGYEEGQSLELKQQVNDSNTREPRGSKPKDDAQEFAKDVTALANGGGGLLAVGIIEDGDGKAVELLGVPGGEKECLRLAQILGSRVQPPLPHSIGRVQLDNGNEVILIAVEGGPLRPHSIRYRNSASLLYPVRRGRLTEYLTEPEVADSYSRRFTSAEQRARTLDTFHEEFANGLPTEHRTWVALSVLPSNPATRIMTGKFHSDTRDWLNNREVLDLVDAQAGAWRTQVGYQSIIAVDDVVDPMWYAALRLDGSSSVARGYRNRWRDAEEHTARASGEGAPEGAVSAPSVLSAFIDSLLVAATHAKLSGASGDAGVAVQLVTSPATVVKVASGHSGNIMSLTDGGAYPSTGSSRATKRTIDLPAMLNDPALLVQAATMLATDLVSEYGLSGVPVADDEGHIIPGVLRQFDPQLFEWAQRNGLLNSPDQAT